MNRLDLLASLAEGSETLLDVGCDHAYAIIKAITKYNVKRGIAADVAKGPLLMAEDRINEAGLKDKVKLVLSDGFKEITDSFDTCIIAGMGGILISNILKAGSDKIRGKKLILEPNSDADIVRSFLASNGFAIDNEYAINDMGKYYEIIVASSKNTTYSDLEIKYGPILLKEKPKAFIEHYSTKLAYLEKLLEKIANKDVLEEKKRLISEYKEIIK